MNEKEMSAKMMAVINRIAQNANDPVYVKNTAEDFLGDLFCDYLKNGARAMFCMTDKGPAYILDTEYGSYSVPFVVLNKKLAAALSTSASTMIESEDEKKNLVYDLDNDACSTNKLNDIVDAEEHHTIIKKNEGTGEDQDGENTPPATTVPFDVSNTNKTPEDTIEASIPELRTSRSTDNATNSENDFSTTPKEIETESHENVRNEETDMHDDHSALEFAQATEAENIQQEMPVSNEIKAETDTIETTSAARADEKNGNAASNIAAFRDSFATQSVEDPSEEYDDEEDESYRLNAKWTHHQNSEDMQNVYQEALTDANNEEQKKDNDDTQNFKKVENGEKPKQRVFLWGLKKNVTQEEKNTPLTSDGGKNKKFSAISEVIENVESKPFEYPNDGGELFKHTHHITITMKYNVDAVIGTYTVEFWPTWIQTRIGANGQTYAECLVRISDDKGTEMIAVTDRTNKEFTYKFQGTTYTFKMVGVWNSGMLTTHVSIDDDSKYKLIDDFKREEPRNLTRDFLDQFESIERGQPQYFIVPLRSDNRGEAKIPIIGIAKDGNSKYILARLNDNTCQYRHNNKTREISGHWENGKFCISIV